MANACFLPPRGYRRQHVLSAYRRPKALSVLALLLTLLFGPDAQAVRVTLCFGAQESLRTLAPTGLLDAERQPLELAAKRTTECFGLPRTVKDDGLVLKVVGQEKSYMTLPEPAEVDAMQKAGFLPRPLPSSALQNHETLSGHMLWVLLLVLGAAIFVWSLRIALQVRAEEKAQGLPVTGRPLLGPLYMAVAVDGLVLIMISVFYAISLLRAWLIT